MPPAPRYAAPATHALQRSLSAMVRDFPGRMEEKKKRDAVDSLVEREQQFQIVIGGEAAPRIEKAAWTTYDLKFELEFPFEPYTQRDPDFDVPTFTQGVWIKSATPVAVFNCIQSWQHGENGIITGATMAVSALALGVPKGGGPVPFSGELHVVFQGYAAPSEIADGSAQDDAVEDEPQLPPTS